MQQGHAPLKDKHQLGSIAIKLPGSESAIASPGAQQGSGVTASPSPVLAPSDESDKGKRVANVAEPEPSPDKYVLETRLIELGAALTSAQHLFKRLERDFYLATFGRYDD
jgi:hypothetical protein